VIARAGTPRWHSLHLSHPTEKIKAWADTGGVALANDAKPVDDLLDASDLPGGFLGELFVAVAADVSAESQHAFCEFAANPAGRCEQVFLKAAG
jgi:hypothetical protein